TRARDPRIADHRPSYRPVTHRSKRLSGIHTNAQCATALKQRIRDLIGAKQWASCQKTVVFSAPMFVYRVASESLALPRSSSCRTRFPRREDVPVSVNSTSSRLRSLNTIADMRFRVAEDQPGSRSE